MSRLRQKEEALEEDALDWLVRERGFQELFGRKSNKNLRIDAIGEMDGALCLVETKGAVSRRCMDEIRSKLSEALSVHDRPGSRSALTLALTKLWRPETAPLFVLLVDEGEAPKAMRLRDGIAALAENWRFAWAIWVWNGSSVAEVAADRSRLGAPRNFVGRIEKEPAPSSRRAGSPKKSWPELEREAARLGLAEIYAAFLDEARSCRLRPQANAGFSVTLYDKGASVLRLRMDAEGGRRGALAYGSPALGLILEPLGAIRETGARNFNDIAWRMTSPDMVRAAVRNAASAWKG